MSQRLFRLIGSLVVVTGICTPMSPAQPLHCSNSSLAGAYGFSVTGTFVTAGLAYAIAGSFVSNGDGELNGTAVQSVNGSVTRNGFTANYTVAADCTGTARLTFDVGAETGLSFTIVSDGREVILIDTDPGTVETGSAKRQ
jgi:hypothetical protein